MFNKKVGLMLGLSLCCLVGCTPEKQEVNNLNDVETQESISVEINNETIEAELSQNSEGSYEVIIQEEEANPTVVVEKVDRIEEENIDSEEYEILKETDSLVEAEKIVDSEMEEVVIAESEENDVANTVISSVGTITAIEDGKILVAVDNANETYANISDETVCDSNLVVGDRVMVKHSLIETRSFPGMWPQVYEITKIAN